MQTLSSHLFLQSLFLLLLSGCISENADPVVPAELPTLFSIEDCTIVTSTSTAPTDSSQTIAGWPASQIPDTPQLEIGVCAKVHLADQVLNDVSFVILKTSTGGAPADCRVADNNVKILQWGLFNNVTATKYLQSYGAPVHFAEISVSVDPAGTSGSQISWEYQGISTSLASLRGYGALERYNIDLNLAWENEVGVVVLAQTQESQTSPAFENFLVGSVDSRMAGAPEGNTWIGTDLLHLISYSPGNLHQFVGTDCKHALEGQESF